ncbi:MAG: hypothetical protein ACD_65C00039G0002 [uncultured bacterium]|nr:MAG: hypothetical protein ACD_65C00039G0002 [uncultured bacterium]KKT02812.1 MAG: glutamyl-tRNA(Gln) amidotransferase subunit B, aspartyl-tRNA(Asn)/glutamyl-tRNA (Gln) amidotransferase subunit B [Candidatus Peregrinibacteria bacterium GW2011_GWF2_43_17]KKT19495.1 MAG: Aspartyl/glutamyl-tRNA(Asn/Gln) amidotransferase subunit B [Candidatus Peregrinibacteria bacterium GW2011_GWA2_43_8]HAU39680.1 Asp-tRNA(Asn)/Glu-tRNA(Gln) amidotransferase GatCAB subunit B [Candidatus Peregrinibacteria bacterium
MYEPIIGLEIHAQVNTKTKMFCGCDNDSFKKAPNINVCPVCMGFPGILPIINKEVYLKGIKSALALNCKIPNFAKFDRKNYFYPDLPKGYQISEYDQPISENGYIEFEVDGEIKKVGITRLHLEDDAGKLEHSRDSTLCDYNRAGTPLLEIVSEPELYSTRSASAYAREMRKILRYIGSSDCDMEKGMMRFDINISIRKKGEKKFGTKVEVKNLNSFKFLEKALDYEFKRQVELLEKGEKIIQETRGWDTEEEITVPQRSKEDAHDYRYFPEPDLPPMIITKKEITAISKDIPELPLKRKHRFIKEFGLKNNDAETLIETPELSTFFEKTAKLSSDPRSSNAFITTVLLKHLNEDQKEFNECKVTPESLAELITLVNKGEISNNAAKVEVFEEMYKTGDTPTKIVEKKGLKQVSDMGTIEEMCKKVIAENPNVVTDIKNGKDKADGFLIGKVMQLSKGKANPGLVSQTIKKLLS